MRSLFFKLFLSFIFITLFASFTTAMVSYWVQIGPYRGIKGRLEFLQSQILNDSLVAAGVAVVALLDSGGEKAVVHYLRELEEETRSQIFVLNSQGALSGRILPPALKNIVAVSQQSDRGQSNISEKEIMVVHPLKGAGGQVLTIAGIAAKKIRPDMFFKNREGVFGAQKKVFHNPLSVPFFLIGVMILGAGVACYFLARSLTAPIRGLRNATQQISKGDFSARVTLAKRIGGEVADLSHDFNTMAERTQSLIQSQKRLLRDISHELRSPLTRLNVALELVRQQCSHAEPNLLRIEKESFRLNELIEQLLTLTRLENGVNNIPREAVNLKEMLAGIVHDADFEGFSKKRRVNVLHLDEITIPASREMLGRALENVIRNALQYTAAGTNVEVSLSTGKEYAVINVQDHGAGVPDEYLEQIFEPFFRVAESRGRDSGGTGIGLAIARQAILMHGGRITAQNGEIDGLLVEIRLPL